MVAFDDSTRQGLSKRENIYTCSMHNASFLTRLPRSSPGRTQDARIPGKLGASVRLLHCGKLLASVIAPP
jgi:hypothetical protein